MVRLTDTQAQALSVVGTGRLTREQVENVLETFTHRSHISSIPFYFSEGALMDACFATWAYSGSDFVKLCSISASCDTDIEPIVRMFIHSDTWKSLHVELEAGHDHWDYQLSFSNDDKTVFGGFFFTYNRMPITVID